MVRGEDLADNTARQLLLQEALALKHPHYLHTPLVLGVNGEKLSKQNGAKALDLSSNTAVGLALQAAASALGLSTQTHLLGGAMQLELALSNWTQDWAAKYPSVSP